MTDAEILAAGKQGLDASDHHYWPNTRAIADAAWDAGQAAGWEAAATECTDHHVNGNCILVDGPLVTALVEAALDSRQIVKRWIDDPAFKGIIGDENHPLQIMVLLDEAMRPLNAARREARKDD